MKSEIVQDLEQQKIILKEINLILQRQNQTSGKSMPHAKFDKKGNKKEKAFILLAVATISMLSFFVLNQYHPSQAPPSTGPYLQAGDIPDSTVQNLQGDTIKTWFSWRLSTGQVLHVDIMNEGILSQDQISAIKDAILSKQTLTIDDSLVNEGPAGTASTYYKGWQGALDAVAVKGTTFQVPDKFEISDAPSGTGEIIIQPTSDESPDGLSGVTKSISDGHQILKATITIYSANSLSPSMLGAITRHEFGHALGLAHSTDTQDLMHAVIQTGYPFVSSCDVNAITELYDGRQSSQVVCGK